MRETLCQNIVVSNGGAISDQFSIDENSNEVTLIFDYIKDTEAGINITVERADQADDIWSTISGTTDVGIKPLTPYTLQISATSTLAYRMEIISYGFYRVRFNAQDVVVKNGTLSIYVVKDK